MTCHQMPASSEVGQPSDFGLLFTSGPGLPESTGLLSLAIDFTSGQNALCLARFGSCGLCGPPSRCGAAHQFDDNTSVA